MLRGKLMFASLLMITLKPIQLFDFSPIHYSYVKNKKGWYLILILLSLYLIKNMIEIRQC